MELIGDETRPVARKDYDCDACPWIFNGDIDEEHYTPEELEEIESVMEDGMLIKKGQQYVRQVFKDGGDIYTFRARLDMHDLCLKYDLYQDA